MSIRPLIKLNSTPKSSPFMSAMLLGIAVAIIGSIIWRMNDPVESEIVTDPKLISKTIGDVQFQIPANMFRYRQQRKNSAPDRVDIFFQWPQMEGYTQNSAPIFDEGDSKNLIFMSISAQETGMSPEARLKTIYKRFLGAPISAPAGLTGKRFLDGHGYDGEDLFYEDKPDKPFIARCLQDINTEIVPMCLREIKIGEKTHIVYAFRRIHLMDWTIMDETILNSFLKTPQ